MDKQDEEVVAGNFLAIRVMQSAEAQVQIGIASGQNLVTVELS